MLPRIFAIALNTYREAVRARLLLGVFALGIVTSLYSLVVAALSLGNERRVVADLGAASFSLYGVLIAIVIGSTSLHRELEYKTIFPILSRPIRRWEYLVGKYLGALLTIAVFVAAQAAAVLSLLAIEAGRSGWLVGAFGGGMIVALAAVWLSVPAMARVFAIIPWALIGALVACFISEAAREDRQLVIASAVLAICEIAIVTAIATLFASFSSPFLTAIFTAMLFVIGRSSDSLAHLPKRVLGESVASGGRVLARIVPNLHTYVPPRPLLLGQVAGHPVWLYVGEAALHAVFYSIVLLAAGVLAFQKRDFS